jgi:uridine kinase
VPDEDFIQKVKARMQEIIDAKIPIMKRSLPTHEAVKRFHQHKMYDKEWLFYYRRSSRVNIYSINGFEDYFYGFMVRHTGYIRFFDLFPYDEGFVLLLPEGRQQCPDFHPSPKVFGVQKEAQQWADRLEVATVGALNDKIAQGKIQDVLLVQEAMQEAKIAGIADQIFQSKNKKFIMIAGPSSSGKTTFSHRLSIQLSARGMRPHPVALDNYFIDRKDIPLQEDGSRDFENLDIVDIEGFNRDMTALLRGEPVDMPEYNFEKGIREYKGNILQLGKEDVLVIEGIHGLNERLSHSLPEEFKFKIYISALTQLNIDEHNRIPTTDGRLIRRIVRDARTRATSAKETIAMWDLVRRGEEKNIFPYQESADVIFNSGLIYELSCLKVYAEPLLFQIGKEEKEYNEAKRLLKFLDYFLAVPSEAIPNNSILREFVGGSCFRL